MSGNSTVDIPTNAVYVNSSSTNAVRTNGVASLQTPDLYVCGGTHFTGQSGCTGTVHCSVAPYMDPLAGVHMPTSEGQTDRGSVSVNGGAAVTIQPGYYSGGISITGSSTVTFAPGVYLIRNQLRISSGNVSGNGVCFVMLGGSLSISGCSSLTLMPMTSGDLQGCVIVQPSGNTAGMSLTGGSETNITGAVYVPGATLTLTGNSTLSGNGPQMGDMVDANRVTISGTGSVKIGRPASPALALPSMPMYD